MNPELIQAAVTAAIQLIAFLLQARANGHLTDEQLEQFTTGTNAETRELIKKALGG